VCLVVGDKKHVKYFYTESGMMRGMLRGRRIREDRKLNISMRDKYASNYSRDSSLLTKPE